MTQPNEPVDPAGSPQPVQGPGRPAVPTPDPAPTQPLPPAGTGAPPPGAPPAGPTSPPPAGPPPRGPGLWRQATSTTGGLIAVIVAACLVALLFLGLVGAGVAVAAHVIAVNHREQRIERAFPGQPLTPGQRKKLQQLAPGRGLGPQGLGGPGGGQLKQLLGGAAGLGAVQHGEFTVTGSDGKATVMTIQRGSVTKASTTSVTVKSTDGFTATYTIDSTTRGTKAGALATGDTVVVIAQKSGATAVLIRPISTS